MESSKTLARKPPAFRKMNKFKFILALIMVLFVWIPISQLLLIKFPLWIVSIIGFCLGSAAYNFFDRINFWEKK
jgi:predicted membrane channel-forming protein YqfA (hemolysin III family)